MTKPTTTTCPGAPIATLRGTRLYGRRQGFHGLSPLKKTRKAAPLSPKMYAAFSPYCYWKVNVTLSASQDTHAGRDLARTPNPGVVLS